MLFRLHRAGHAAPLIALLACALTGFPPSVATAGADGQLELAPLHTGELRWYYNHAGAPPLVSSARIIEAGEEAARAWAPCGVTITYLASTTAAPGVRDGVNVVGWGRGLYNAVPFGDPGGVTLPWVENGQAVEVDIVLVPQTVRTTVELRTVLMHEFGHAVGVGHSPKPGSLMSASGSTDDMDAHPRPSRAELQRCKGLYRKGSE
ncbi:MAG TPA: matrixin family metalloprotease [Burkholderiales bacterium]